MAYSGTPTPASFTLAALLGNVCATFTPPGYVDLGGFRLRVPDGVPIDNDLRVIVHRSRSSALTVYRRGDRTEKLTIQSNGLTRMQYLALRDHIDNIRGTIVNYTDSYGEVISGTVVSFRPVEGSYSHGYDVEIGFEVA